MANPFSTQPPSQGFGNNDFGFNVPGSTPGGAPKQNKNQIITSLYRSILGREPDSNALMYYISQPEINEDQVRKQMLDSEEHKNILKEFKNIAILKKEIEDLKKEVDLEHAKVEDKQLEIDQLNTILSHKTNELGNLRRELETVQHTTEHVHNGANESIPLPKDMGIRKKIKDLFNKS